ncbi:MAG: beta-eliminating lyase-related protein [Pseudomonadota bacterium]
MNFSSDTAAPAHPAVLEALAKVNAGHAPSYGADAAFTRAKAAIAETFETEVEIWLTASGTASNALALACFCPPTGAVLCHEESHLERDERGAPEFFTGGGKLALLPGQGAKVDEQALRAALVGIDHGFVHETPAHVLSLTNLTECGTAYSVAEAAHYAALAKEAGLAVHLDGARLANALVSTGASPAEMTWKAGIDVLSLGFTKTGAMGCEAIVLFGEARAKLAELHARAKRAGHMPPKMRFLAAQAEAMLAGGLWLQLAADANAKARRLADALCALPGVSLAYPTQGNEVFAVLPDGLADRLSAAGAAFYPWPGGSHRFVCAWSTPEADIDALRETVAGAQ